ncbi:MAG: hypothetical protein K2K53_11240, partial [Oscillospiraceae bacterium]|nr:hypothetical protein [Oscillospiraceae bacterium]
LSASSVPASVPPVTGMTTSPFANAVLIIVGIGDLNGLGAIGFCTCLLTADIVFAGQYKNSTLKNEVSFGLGRTKIYLGKLAAQTLLSIAYLVIMMGFYLGACAAVLPLGPDAAHFSAPEALAIVGWYLAVGLPLWIGAQAAACMCQFLIQGDMASSVAYITIIFVLEGILMLAGLIAGGRVETVLTRICGYFPGPVLDGAKATVGLWSYLGKAWLVGAFWVAACTAIGLYGFHKREIK